MKNVELKTWTYRWTDTSDSQVGERDYVSYILSILYTET